jgi:hypothetical protein
MAADRATAIARQPPAAAGRRAPRGGSPPPGPLPCPGGHPADFPATAQGGGRGGSRRRRGPGRGRGAGAPPVQDQRARLRPPARTVAPAGVCACVRARARACVSLSYGRGRAAGPPPRESPVGAAGKDAGGVGPEPVAAQVLEGPGGPSGEGGPVTFGDGARSRSATGGSAVGGTTSASGAGPLRLGWRAPFASLGAGGCAASRGGQAPTSRAGRRAQCPPYNSLCVA